MSVLRLYQSAIAQRAVVRGLYASSRAMSTQPTSAPAETPSKQHSSAVTTTPEREALTADVISGAPAELRLRPVRIFQPTRSTTQSGSGKSHRWRIDWDILQGGGRWENPLMGWASSADYMQGTRMSFNAKEDAIRFAEKQGWDYYIQDPEVKRIPPKNYAENFQYKPNKLRLMRTK